MVPLRRGPTLAGAALLLLLLALARGVAPAGGAAAGADAVAPPSSPSLAQAVAALCSADPTGGTRAAVLRALGGVPGEPAAPDGGRPSRSLLAAEAGEGMPAAAGAAAAAPSASPPWRPPKYPLGTRVLSEFLGTMFTIFVGESALANELLPSTKGHGMGWFATVWTFGLSFYIFLQAFGGVSAKLNPAMCLAQWIAGIITGVDFLCLSLGEVAGAFCGACLVWVMYMPHFKSLPEPPSLAPEDELLRRRDVMQPNALQMASYNTRPERAVGWGRGAAAAEQQRQKQQQQQQAQPQRLAAVGEEGSSARGGGVEAEGVAAAAAGAASPRTPSARSPLAAGRGGLSPADGGAAVAPSTPGAGMRGAATTAIIGAFDNFVYYLKPGVHMPRLDGLGGESALLGGGGGGGGGGGADADPWRDEEAVAERAAAGRPSSPSGPVVAVGAHEMAERYYQHEDQMGRRRALEPGGFSLRVRSASDGGSPEVADAVGAKWGGGGAASPSARGGGAGGGGAASPSARGGGRGGTLPLPPLPRPKDLSRRTVQVADLQRHLADLHVAEVRRRVAPARGGTTPARPPLPQPLPLPSAVAPVATDDRNDGGNGNGTYSNSNNNISGDDSGAEARTTGFSLLPRLAGHLRHHASSAGRAGADTTASEGGGGGGGPGDDDGKHGGDSSGGGAGARRPHRPHHPHLPARLAHLHAPHVVLLPGPTPNLPPLDPEREAYARDCEAAWLLMTAEEQRAHTLYAAALEADRNAKLSIFATRPAIMSPGWNLIAEAIGTFMLVLCALLIELVPEVFLPPEARPMYVRGMQAFLIGITVVVLISALGGPTAYAANPARDFGPRLAHFLLPVSNKGVSEWAAYAWVPVLGPFMGGAAAGAAYHAIRAMFVRYQV